jgi:hypothetical protein
MKKSLHSLLLWIACLLVTGCIALDFALADVDCTPVTESGPNGIPPFSDGCGDISGNWDLVTLHKSEERLIRWPDLYWEWVEARSKGECVRYFPNCHWRLNEGFAGPETDQNPGSSIYRAWKECWPEFWIPSHSFNGTYAQIIYRAHATTTEVSCSSIINDFKVVVSCIRGLDTDSVSTSHTCIGDEGGGGGGGGGSCHDLDYDGYTNCAGDCNDSDYYTNPGRLPDCDNNGDHNCNGIEDFLDCIGSPVIIDISGNGFDLTDALAGVLFDLDSDGSLEKRAWTTTNSDDAWLALDRNGNGLIDNGQELFGNYTPQPSSANPNGFLALAEYDKGSTGGNNDGKISGADAIYSSLRLWQDANHNGISEPGELHRLRSLGVFSIDIDYKESRRRDEHGNWFRYRAKVQGVQVGTWAWDVFLLRTNQGQ